MQLERNTVSLLDVDKNSSNRLTPQPNADDGVINRMAHNTMGNTYRTTGLDVTPRMAFKNGVILTYDSENRVSSVYGYIPELQSTPVLIIANEGYDVYVDLLGITPPEV